MDFGSWGGRDLAAAVSFLARRPGVPAGKNAVLGESMGDEQALAAMGLTRGSGPWSPRAPSGQQYADRGWRADKSPGSSTAAGNGCSTPRPGRSRRPAASSIAMASAPPLPPALIIAAGVASGPVAARWFPAPRRPP